ncbi:hypothetical protein LSCM1_04416 [Leishmania martiniquensis]|uniref:Uncharacterized protein n=1 Tax=Leishmania martiniquensis TaxID=1580590 RepID=A0A836H9Z2_9TRYP|nr:hypothetical protein LSCM1_04416 [Leishmania martiniquensis]
MVHTRFSSLPVAVRAAILALCTLSALVCLAAVGARTPSVPQQYRDKRVAQLRAALLDSALHRLEALPEPPLALGVHTACIKFGLGCPDAYIQFLEELLTPLRGPHADGDIRRVAGGQIVEEGTETAKRQAQRPGDANAATQAQPTLEPPEQCVGDVDSCAAATAASAVELLSRDLRLPLQLSWAYEARKRLENLLHLLSAREAELRKEGVSLTWLQRRYQVPSAEHIHLVEDLGGAMTARLHNACAVGSLPSASLPEGLTEETWEGVYGLWCRYAAQQYQARRGDDFSATHATALLPSSLLLLPPKAWYCTALQHATLYLQLLVQADSLLTWAWSWTLYVAMPSALMVCVFMWLCAGDAWTEAAEAFVLNASATTSNATGEDDRWVNEGGEGRPARVGTIPHEGRPPSPTTESLSPPPTSPTTRGAEAALSTPPVVSVAPAEGRHDAAPAPHDAVTALERYHRQRHRQQQRQQQRRAALLRCRFVECALHRSSTLFFLKLRLLLCLLVAGQLLWSLWRVLTASYDATASAAPLLQFFLPSWLLTCLSAYLVVPLQMMLLGTALKGALSAHEELLSFQAKCAAEQRALLNAAGLPPLSA